MMKTFAMIGLSACMLAGGAISSFAAEPASGSRYTANILSHQINSCDDTARAEIVVQFTSEYGDAKVYTICSECGDVTSSSGGSGSLSRVKDTTANFGGVKVYQGKLDNGERVMTVACINSDDAAMQNVTANVRQLEGTINKILAYKDLLGSDTDEETVTRAIQDMLRRSNEYIPTPEAILDYISKYYNVEESVIRGQQRIRDAVQARQIAIYLIRSMTNLSLDDIGKEFDNRDHSTVLYSIQQVEKKMKKDAAFAEMVKEIKTNITAKR